MRHLNYYKDNLYIRKLKLDRIEISNASNYEDNKQEEASIYKKLDKLKEEGKVDRTQRESDLIRGINKVVIYEDVKLYDYAYRGFLKLRAMDGITSNMIKYSLCPDMNLESAKKAQESTGKSGSFFFFSFDKRFIIKTMFTSELDKFMESISDYFMYIHNNPGTLIARIYGIFQI